jgi:hypothetical protein
MTRHEEWHVTVLGDPVLWGVFCSNNGIKPLYIELNNYERQLMCACRTDPTDLIRKHPRFTIIRRKHEVNRLFEHEIPLYYEQHVKFDGRFDPSLPWSSRDLFRQRRWYLTKRWRSDFNPIYFADTAKEMATSSKLAGWEYEICVEDTNPELDARWR